MKHTLIATAAISALLIAGTTVQAQMPADAPYNTDPQNLYVQDDTSQGIANLNMVLCVIGSMSAGDMVNSGPYIALVDMNKCNNKGGGSSSAAGATNYATAVVNVTRASNTDPMIGKIWLSMTDDGGATDVFAYLSATQSPWRVSVRCVSPGLCRQAGRADRIQRFRRCAADSDQPVRDRSEIQRLGHVADGEFHIGRIGHDRYRRRQHF